MCSFGTPSPVVRSWLRKLFEQRLKEGCQLGMAPPPNTHTQTNRRHLSFRDSPPNLRCSSPQTSSLSKPEGKPTPFSFLGAPPVRGWVFSVDSATTITKHTQSQSTCHPLTLTLLLPTFLTLWFWDARIVKLPLPRGAIQSLQAPAHNKTGSPPREKTNVRFCLFAMEARERKISPSERMNASWVMGAPMSWLTSQGQNETFCWPIYVIGGEPNDVLEERWVSGHHSSLQMRLVN